VNTAKETEAGKEKTQEILVNFNFNFFNFFFFFSFSANSLISGRAWGLNIRNK